MLQKQYAGKFTVEKQMPCFHIIVKDHSEAVELVRLLSSSPVMIQFENCAGEMLLGERI